MINAPAGRVWAALTEPALMNKWMAETPLDIITDWQSGSPIAIRGQMYKKPFENSGTVLAFEPEQHLSYTHLSSLSKLPDAYESHSILDFRLSPNGDKTSVTLTVTNFPTDTIYKHLAFYWNVALEMMKRSAEQV